MVCPRHGAAIFHRYASESNRAVRWRCGRCVGESVTRRNRRKRALLVAEAGGACRSCGYARCSSNLHFHHVDPAQKAFALNMGRSRALAALREEARKCVLVCANCHGEIEAGLRPCPPLLREEVA